MSPFTAEDVSLGGRRTGGRATAPAGSPVTPISPHVPLFPFQRCPVVNGPVPDKIERQFGEPTDTPPSPDRLDPFFW